MADVDMSYGPKTRGGPRGKKASTKKSAPASRKSAAPTKSKRPAAKKATGFMGKVKASLAAGRKRKAEQNKKGTAMDRAKAARALR
jgi:hypothetical protein